VATHANLGRARDAVRNARRSYPFTPPPDLGSGKASHHPLIIAGAGPIGLATALDLAHNGIKSIILEKRGGVSDGSRAICWSKRTLEILDRLGTAASMVDKGVTWNVGHVHVGAASEPIYSFDLLADKAQQFPAFINLQQYYAEEFLIDAVARRDDVDIRWQNEVVGVSDEGDHVRVTVQTPAGRYDLTCAYLIAADGHRSPVRNLLGLSFEGRVFEDHFLIADVKMKVDFPAERRFWFDPPFNRGQTSLLHKQADDVWRIDFQLGWDIDREAALSPESVETRVRGFLGADADFEYEWVSLYTFQCRRMERFVHGRVIFAGDAAHLVSPFGARGANGGIQDADNLAWKLALILKGRAPRHLLESYDVERTCAADENILHSSRATDFMTPKSRVSRALRDAILDLARDYPFARGLVNSGRLSTPCVLEESPLNTPDSDEFTPKQRPGTPCIDAPVEVDGRAAWLLGEMRGGFTLLCFADARSQSLAGLDALRATEIPIEMCVVRPAGARPPAGPYRQIVDAQGLVQAHYDAMPGTCYLIRPDQHVAARWRRSDAGAIARALARATARA
jgi:3-(3-hydroxy-phenyl)propionate hydroxylase